MMISQKKPVVTLKFRRMNVAIIGRVIIYIVNECLRNMGKFSSYLASVQFTKSQVNVKVQIIGRIGVK